MDIRNYEQTIVLKENDIEEIESLRYLGYLRLWNVNLSRLPRCNNLKVLHINLSNLTELSINPKVQLNKLFCHHCKNLKSIPKDLNDSLEVLHLIDCTKITSLPDHLINLTILSTFNTHIADIPKTFVNLHKLSVSKQLITSIPKELVNLIEGNALELPRV